jgi:hypothetical protein
MAKAWQFTMPSPEDSNGSISQINFLVELEPKPEDPRFPPADKNRGFAADKKNASGRQEEALKSPP